MADLPQLKYLECCIKEALRLFPSVPMFSRILTQDTTFRAYSPISISLHSFQNNDNAVESGYIIHPRTGPKWLI